MKLSITQFSGEMPVVAPQLLPENSASETYNARMEGGSLVPIRDLLASGFAAPATTVNSWAIYPFDKTKVLTRTDDADFIRGPIANDAWKRVYSAGANGQPLVHYSVSGELSSLPLGINRPPTPTVPSSWESATPSDPVSQPIRCAYYTTFVTGMGEESEPSFTTQVITRWDGAEIPLTLGPATDSRAVSRRVYRSEGGGVFNFVAEVDSSEAIFTDDVYSADLGNPCNTEAWNPPPVGLKGLTMVGNGFMAGFFGNTLCFSEPYYPHAWPLDYQLAFPDDIVSMAMVGGSLIVATTGNPWVVSGAHPSAMSQTGLDVRASCLSRRGHVDMGDYSLYPTSEGLMMAGPSGMQLVSKGVYSRQQWLALQPATFRAFRYREQYLCFGAVKSFIFNMESGVFPLQLSGDPGDTVLNGHYQADDDRLYLLIKHSNNTRSVQIFDAGDNKTMVWKSREFVLSPSVVMSAGRIDADASVTLTLTGDNYDFTTTVTTDKGFRLPAGRPRRLTMQVECAGRVNAMTVASAMGELL